MSGQSSEPGARFEVPLYRMAEAAKYLGVPTATFVTWAKGYVRQPPDRPVVKAQPDRDCSAKPRQELSDDPVCRARGRDGAGRAPQQGRRVAAHPTRPRELVVVRNNQRVFAPLILDYLERIEYGPDGYARLIRLPEYRYAEVVADPERSFGQPIFARGAARVADVLERFWAGEDLSTVADEFGIPPAELEDVLRVASRRAA